MSAWIRRSPTTAIGLLILTLCLLFSGLLVLSVSVLGLISLAEVALVAESFGIVSALFAAISLLLIILTVSMQREELSLQRKEMQRMMAIQAETMRIELFSLALDDPLLIEVQGRANPTSIETKQLLYANMMTHYVWANFVSGMLGEEGLEGEMLIRFRRSRFYREYWETSQDAWATVGLGSREELFHDPEMADTFRRITTKAYRAVVAELHADPARADDS